MPRRHLLAEARRLGDAQPVVIVDAEDHLVAERLARLARTTRRCARYARAARRRRVFSCPLGDSRMQLQPASTSSFACSIISGPGARAGGGEGRDAVALLAAEQLVDRHAQRLALDVVQGDVDRRDRGGEHPAALEILAAVHLLPERADLHRIAADEELAIVLDARRPPPSRGRTGRTRPSRRCPRRSRP